MVKKKGGGGEKVWAIGADDRTPNKIYTTAKLEVCTPAKWYQNEQNPLGGISAPKLRFFGQMPNSNTCIFVSLFVSLSRTHFDNCL